MFTNTYLEIDDKASAFYTVATQLTRLVYIVVQI